VGAVCQDTVEPLVGGFVVVAVAVRARRRRAVAELSPVIVEPVCPGVVELVGSSSSSSSFEPVVVEPVIVELVGPAIERVLAIVELVTSVELGR
jgi:hypothetical protein